MSDMLSLSEKGSTRLGRVTFGSGRARLAECFCYEISNLKFEILNLLGLFVKRLVFFGLKIYA